jgi:hypothetical protein
MQHNGFTIVEETEPLSLSALVAVIYGPPGMGKTSLSFTMPGPILHIDADEGLRRAVQNVRPKSVRLQQYEPFFSYVMSQAFAAYVQEQGFKTVVVDTVGKLLDSYITPYLIAKDPKNGNYTGGLSLPGWGGLKTNFYALHNRFKSLGLNICYVCHAKEAGEANNLRYELAVSGGSADTIYTSCDLLGFMSVRGDGSRILSFTPTSQKLGKNIGNIPDMQVPDAGTPEYAGFMASIFDRVIETMSAQSAEQIAFNAALDEWKDTLETRNTPADFDKTAKDIKAMPAGLLQNTVQSLFVAAVLSKGFRFDKGKVVAPEPITEPAVEDETA